MTANRLTDFAHFRLELLITKYDLLMSNKYVKFTLILPPYDEKQNKNKTNKQTNKKRSFFKQQISENLA